jgi:hypothetical protein
MLLIKETEKAGIPHFKEHWGCSSPTPEVSGFITRGKPQHLNQEV